MATRFYLRNTTDATGISPTPDAGWEVTASLVRAVANTTSTADAMADVTDIDAEDDDTDRDYLSRQYVSAALTAGQTVTGSQALKAQCRCQENDAANNMFFAVGIRVIASDGTTVRKTVLAVTRDGVEMVVAPTAATNRQFTATSAATNYTTQTGDRLVIEIGAGGNPSSGGNHEYTLRLGDAAGADLAEDDASTTDNRPWVQLNDTLTFTAGTSQPVRSMQQFRTRRAG
jgi:hypothetical protein